MMDETMDEMNSFLNRFNKEELIELRDAIDDRIEKLAKKKKMKNTIEAVEINELISFLEIFNKEYRHKNWTMNNFFVGLDNWIEKREPPIGPIDVHSGDRITWIDPKDQRIDDLERENRGLRKKDQ